jgi:hypothetical protein
MPLFVKADSKTRVMTLSIILDLPIGSDDINILYNKLIDFLTAINYKKWTFVVWDNAFDYWIYNTTRLNTIKQYGEVIPRLAYMQSYNPIDRKNYVDNIFQIWHDYVGYYPSGIHDYTFPDTYVANYIKTAYPNVLYYQGVTLDAYKIDYVSALGSWQLPYYHDSGNIMLPKKNGKSLVMLPHVIWDWYASFTVYQDISTHPIGILNRTYPNNVENARLYFFRLIENNMEAIEPYAYSTVQFEWCWLINWHDNEIVEDWIQTLLTYPYTFTDFKEFSSWFSLVYDSNPTYTINFLSPYNNEKVEWYWDTDYRIARHNGKVVSYVEYNKQSIDRYLTTHRSIEWGNPESVIQISLNLTINALGGGLYRSPKTTPPYSYPESLPLSKFYQNYKLPEKTIQTSFMIILLFTILGLLGIGLLLRHRSKSSFGS